MELKDSGGVDSMESYNFLFIIAIILLSTKIFGLLSQKVHMPQVVGALLVGILLGPGCLGILHETDFLLQTAEIGVILLMFQAGLDTEFDELKKAGKASLVIALIGVIVPFFCGAGICWLFFYTSDFTTKALLQACFVGVILTATSVSITVETLREMEKLKGKVGVSILGAAIIDDILGIMALAMITGISSPENHIGLVILKIFLFFIFIAVCGWIVFQIFRYFQKKHPQGKRRIAIYAISFCLLLSYISEVFFGISDITGAYFAGLILCNLTDIRNYIVTRICIISYMFFTPIFFAGIGMKTEVAGMSSIVFTFSLILLIGAVLSKVIGCGLGAKLCKYENKEALSVGIGMISRGEVALIVAQKGAQIGLISLQLFPAIVLVVIGTTMLTPILLKLQMK